MSDAFKVTKTGRMQSAEPNLANGPKPTGCDDCGSTEDMDRVKLRRGRLLCPSCHGAAEHRDAADRSDE